MGMQTTANQTTAAALLVGLRIEELISEEELVRRTGKSRWFFWRARRRKRGRLRHYKVGKQVCYHPRDVDRWLEKACAVSEEGPLLSH